MKDTSHPIENKDTALLNGVAGVGAAIVSDELTVLTPLATAAPVVAAIVGGLTVYALDHGLNHPSEGISDSPAGTTGVGDIHNLQMLSPPFATPGLEPHPYDLVPHILPPLQEPIPFDDSHPFGTPILPGEHTGIDFVGPPYSPYDTGVIYDPADDYVVGQAMPLPDDWTDSSAIPYQGEGAIGHHREPE